MVIIENKPIYLHLSRLVRTEDECTDVSQGANETMERFPGLGLQDYLDYPVKAKISTLIL
jgi:hypothetical protein